jgi:parallel beta-helix repeat protein
MRRPVFGLTFAGLMLILLFTSTLVPAFNVQPVRSSPATIIVPDDYPTIQAAIDNASAGDTIFVRAGTYNCNIQIDKPLTLKGESNQNTTLRLQRGENLMALHVIASNVTVSGFHLIGPESGSDSVMLIVVDGRAATADNCVIKDNVLEEYLDDALVLFGSHGDEVVGNVISSQGGSCVFVYSSSNCLIRNNSLSGSEWVGIFLGESSNNTVSNNFITNQIDSQSLEAGAITLGAYSDDNTVTGNTLVNNDYGVTCWHYTQNNVIYHNNFVNNTHQTHNYLDVPSPLPANFWDNGYPSGGNYWSDYNGTDSFSGPYQNVTGSDGIGDAPYVMDAVSSDRYPLMIQWKNPVGDLNGDGKVSGLDVALAAWSFASYGPDFLCQGSPASPRWNLDADVNGNNKIDGTDIAMITRDFGKS